MRSIVIGDIHGCFRELQALLKKVRFEQKSDRLILLGDVIDRGPDSGEVLELCRNLKEEMGERFIQLLGNHEDLMLDAYYQYDMSLWDANGGAVTRKTLPKEKQDREDLLAYIRTLPLYYETEQYICVHAAISRKGAALTERETALWDRKLADEGAYSGKLVICGHTPVKKVLYQPGDGTYREIIAGRTQKLPETGSICLDTGCVFKNKLSAMIIEEKQGAWEYQVRQADYGKK